MQSALMRSVVVVGLSWVIGQAAAGEAPPQKYVFGNFYRVVPDDARSVDGNAGGLDLGFGYQLGGPFYAEFRGYRAAFETISADRQSFYDTGLGVDLQVLIGHRGDFAAFLVGGVGYGYNDVNDPALDSGGYQLNAGVGLVSRAISSSGIRVRAEWRAIREDFLGGLQDFRGGIGIEIPLDPVEVVIREVSAEAPPQAISRPSPEAYPPRPSDSDRDGVLDYFDVCNNTPLGSKVDRAGCLVGGGKLVLEGVRFAMGSAQLLDGSVPKLDRAAAALLAQPQRRVTVAGYTDNLGGEEYNQELSWGRASAVANYLIAKGVKRAQIQVLGYGSADPIASNETEDGRRRNRRVELHLSE